jgi:undecaprenyl-diphosphatase
VSIFQAVVLGLVQGLTEFLPVSSSGHLILVPAIFGWEVQDLAFDAVLHLATLAAIIFALWDDVKSIGTHIIAGRKDDSTRLGVMLIVATVPVIVAGLLFKDAIETTLRDPIVVAGSLIFWGILLYLADGKVRASAISDVRRVSLRSTFWIGLAQAVALIPGTSRSGVTITAGMFTGLNRQTAARFSFLLGIPSIALAASAGAFDFVRGDASIALAPLLVGFLSAFVSGFFAIRWLLKLLTRGSYKWFAVYRIVLALAILGVL